MRISSRVETHDAELVTVNLHHMLRTTVQQTTETKFDAFLNHFRYYFILIKLLLGLEYVCNLLLAALG